MFENISDAEKQILRDKHSLLEGYVAEYYFKQQFLYNHDNFTNGWWSAVRGKQRFFFLVKNKINKVDYMVLNIIRPFHECWIVYPKGSIWVFTNGSTEYDESEFLDLNSLTPVRQGFVAADSVKNVTRQKRCIDFFKEKDIIRGIAMERNFADDFLSIYFDNMLNIDYITVNSAGRLCVIEVKYKYETRTGHFGINAGQVQLFNILESIGFEIHHMILYNHTKDKNLSIFSFLELDDDKYWLYGRLHDFSSRVIKSAPKETSFSGRNVQQYCQLDMREMSRRISLVNIQKQLA